MPKGVGYGKKPGKKGKKEEIPMNKKEMDKKHKKMK